MMKVIARTSCIACTYRCAPLVSVGISIFLWTSPPSACIFHFPFLIGSLSNGAGQADVAADQLDSTVAPLHWATEQGQDLLSGRILGSQICNCMVAYCLVSLLSPCFILITLGGVLALLFACEEPQLFQDLTIPKLLYPAPKPCCMPKTELLPGRCM
jgi:hypothetical protein